MEVYKTHILELMLCYKTVLIADLLSVCVLGGGLCMQLTTFKALKASIGVKSALDSSSFNLSHYTNALYI